jgi:hypothetical protein
LGSPALRKVEANSLGPEKQRGGRSVQLGPPALREVEANSLGPEKQRGGRSVQLGPPALREVEANSLGPEKQRGGPGRPPRNEQGTNPHPGLSASSSSRR